MAFSWDFHGFSWDFHGLLMGFGWGFHSDLVILTGDG